MTNNRNKNITSLGYLNTRQITKQNEKWTTTTQCYMTLWRLARHVDRPGRGYVVFYFPNLEKTLNTSRATIYRWLQSGRKDGVFRFYRRRGNYLEISYTSSKNIALKMEAADLGPQVVIPVEEIAIKQKTTLHTAKIFQIRSRAAAIKKLRANGDRHTRLAQPKFRGGTLINKPTSQYFPNQKQWGVSQKTLASTLGVSERTVRRHLASTPRVQGLYKVSSLCGQLDQFYSKEERTKPTVFKRKGEYWKYGTNFYQLDYQVKTRWTARLKYKFELLKLFRSRPNNQYKDYLSIEEFFKSDWFSKLNLEELIKIRNFNKFRREITRQLQELKRRRTM